MKFVDIVYIASGKGQGSVVKVNVKLPDGSWSGEKEFVKGKRYIVADNVFTELKKLGGFELYVEPKKPKAKAGGGKK